MLLDLEQNTPEWYKHRINRVGSTAFASYCAIKKMCPNIYNKKLDELVAEIRGDIVKENQFLLKYYHLGKLAEPVILATQGMIQNDQVHAYEANTDIFASIDHVEDDMAVEIKSTTSSIDKIQKKLEFAKFQNLHHQYCGNLNRGKIFVGIFDKELLGCDTIYASDISLLCEYDVDKFMTEQEWLKINLELLDIIKGNSNG